MDHNLGNTKQEDVIELKRHIGLPTAISCIISSMMGSGIFITSGSILKYSGSVGMSLVIWTFCGIIALLNALAFAELASLVPRSGSEYAYFMETYGPMHKFWGPLPGFLYAFLAVFVAVPVGGAVVILTSAQYLMQWVTKFYCIDDENSISLATKGIALVEIGVIAYINCSSVKMYMKLQNICTVLRLAVCFLIIGMGIYQLCIGNFTSLLNGFEGTTTKPENIALALYSGSWAYAGNTVVTMITQEIKNPEVNIPRSVLIAVPLVCVMYLLINVSYLSVLDMPEIIQSNAVAISFGKKLLGHFTVVITLGVAISTFGNTLSSMFATSRLCFVASQSGHLMKFLSFIHVRRLTPVPAVILQTIVVIASILMGNIIDLIEFITFVTIWVATFAMISLIILRKTMKDADRPIKVPLWIPTILILEQIFRFLTPLILSPDFKYMIGVALLVSGILIYCGIIYQKTEIKIMRPITYIVQVIFEVVPQEGVKEE